MRFSLVDNRSTAMRWSSGWYRYETRFAWAGSVHRTLRTDSSVRATVTGRTVAIIAPVSASHGWLKVYVNGTLEAEVSLAAASSASRKIVWQKTYATDGQKVVELRTVRSSTQTRVDVDAILVGR
jgi:hypothetical protein